MVEMTGHDKRFEVQFNTTTQEYGIIDWFETRPGDGICMYDGLGEEDYSAEKLCNLLNELNEENNQVIKVNNQLIEYLSIIGLKTDEALKLLYNR